MSAARTASARTGRVRLDATNLRLLCVLVPLVLVLGCLEGGKLFGVGGLRSMAFQLPELGLLALAMMIPMLSGGIDLSIISAANLCALAMAYAMTTWPPPHGGAGALALAGFAVASLALAALVGLVNGFMIACLRVPPMLATLGTMTAVKGILIGFTHGNVISGFPAPIVFIGQGTWLGIPVVLVLFLAVVAPLSVLINRTPLGRAVAMIGSNEQATRYSGIDTRRSLLWVYLLSALLAASAGLVMVARFNSANAAYGESYLLVAILAAVLGGVSPLGGFGKVSGVILSLLILQLLSTASILLGLSQFITLAMWGAILLLASGGIVFKDWMTNRFRNSRAAARSAQAGPALEPGVGAAEPPGLA
jgi:ribose/xylose/arabinose/galactoside ABC-type transport system permease subunit